MKAPVTLVEPGTVRLERLLPGPLERVWAYITESDKRAKWLASGEFDLRLGGKIRLEFDNCSLSSEKTTPEKYRDRGMGKFDGVITRLEPMRALAHTWAWNGGDTEVSYELTPKGKDVLLTITHRRLPSRSMMLGVSAGWHAHLDVLVARARGEDPAPFWDGWVRLRQEYDQRLPA